MDERFNTLAQQLFQRPLEQCSTEEIKHFTDQHPYYAPAQFLLLKKLQPGTEAYHAQYQKAILYYYHPVHFAGLLEPHPLEEDFIETEWTQEVREPIRQEPLHVPGPEAPPVSEAPKEPVAEAGAINKPESLSQTEEPVREEPVTTSTDKKPVQELTFEPFHTVDYFASLGIKLSQEELPKDQLGKQMKSFTEWLRTMKRLPATELVKAVDVQAEKKVENLAEHSLMTADVVTEAMAEVWARQGNHQKALEVYNKLSLQNPSKRAYFAAKIENLKKPPLI
jgi:hypothetical protein